MSEMVERMARAILAARAKMAAGFGSSLAAFEKQPADIQESLRHEARAAIQAMREPTPAMLSSELSFEMIVQVWHSPVNRRYCWQSMIDEALK